jgi:hypothetical protein
VIMRQEVTPHNVSGGWVIWWSVVAESAPHFWSGEGVVDWISVAAGAIAIGAEVRARRSVSFTQAST